MRHALGVIAARQRGDLDGASALAASFATDADRARAFLLITELAPTIVSDGTGQPLNTIVQTLSLRIAALEAAS
jgi:hypothetical protein